MSVETVVGYGHITEPFDWVDQPDQERLTYKSVNEAVGTLLDEWLCGVAPAEWPETIELCLSKEHEVTEEDVTWPSERLFETLMEMLDEHEKWGHPDEPVEPKNLEACREAMKKAVGFIMRDRPVYWCREVKTIEVNVRQWVESNEPDWLRPTGAQEPEEHTTERPEPVIYRGET